MLWFESANDIAHYLEEIGFNVSRVKKKKSGLSERHFDVDYYGCSGTIRVWFEFHSFGYCVEEAVDNFFKSFLKKDIDNNIPNGVRFSFLIRGRCVWIQLKLGPHEFYYLVQHLCQAKSDSLLVLREIALEFKKIVGYDDRAAADRFISNLRSSRYPHFPNNPMRHTTFK